MLRIRPCAKFLKEAMVRRSLRSLHNPTMSSAVLDFGLGLNLSVTDIPGSVVDQRIIFLVAAVATFPLSGDGLWGSKPGMELARKLVIALVPGIMNTLRAEPADYIED